MYASVNSVYKTVQDFAQKENRGFVTPSQMNNFFARAQQELFHEKMSLFKYAAQGRKRRLQYGNGNNDSIEAIRDDIRTLLVTYKELLYSEGGFIYPDDYSYYDSLVYNGDVVDTAHPLLFETLKNSYLSKPTDICPIALIGTEKILIEPSLIQSGVKLNYYKRPQGVDSSGNKVSLSPSWAYNNVNNQPIYNASNSIDFELPKHLEPELTSLVLSYMGISIREIELIQYAESEQVKESDNRK